MIILHVTLDRLLDCSCLSVLVFFTTAKATYHLTFITRELTKNLKIGRERHNKSSYLLYVQQGLAQILSRQ